MLGACHPEGAEEALDGGILAISPPADPRAMAKRLSLRLPPRPPAYALNYGFRAMLISRVRAVALGGHRGLRGPARAGLGPLLRGRAGGDLAAGLRQDHIAGARVPVLVLHPEDDKVIPVEHARMLAEAAAGNELVRVWILPGGGHGAIDAVDGDWSYAVYRRFLRALGRLRAPGRRPATAARGPVAAKLIYSAAR